MDLPCLQTSSPVATDACMKTVSAYDDTQDMTGTVKATRDAIETLTDACATTSPDASIFFSKRGDVSIYHSTHVQYVHVC